jgi:hypothetical protein
MLVRFSRTARRAGFCELLHPVPRAVRPAAAGSARSRGRGPARRVGAPPERAKVADVHQSSSEARSRIPPGEAALAWQHLQAERDGCGYRHVAEQRVVLEDEAYAAFSRRHAMRLASVDGDVAVATQSIPHLYH